MARPDLGLDVVNVGFVNEFVTARVARDESEEVKRRKRELAASAGGWCGMADRRRGDRGQRTVRTTSIFFAY